METRRFDAITRSFSRLLSRRTAAGALGLGALGLPIHADAKKNKKKKKVKKNEFGCVDVGKFCKNNGQCCSGICKGKKDKKKCQAHDQSTCKNGDQEAQCGGVLVDCQSAAGIEGVCNTTTGKAGFCTNDGLCIECSNDADCQALCGPRAACVLCAGCEEEGGTACVGPEPDTCQDVMI